MKVFFTLLLVVLPTTQQLYKHFSVDGDKTVLHTKSVGKHEFLLGGVKLNFDL